MNDKIILKAVVGIFTLLGLCFSVNAGQGVSNDEIVIGTHTALSGPVAGWGIDASNAIRMRFDEANATGGIHGRKIKYIVEDSQYSVPLAVQKGNKLINRDEIFAMIAGIGTPMNQALFDIQLKKDIPNLFPYSFARSMVEPLHRLKFLVGSTYYDQMRSGTKYFVEEKGKKRVCILYQDTDFGTEHLDGVVDQLNEMNMELVAKISHKPTETNFMGAINKLKNENCDLVALGTIIRDTMLPLQTARKIGWDVDMFGGLGACNSIVAQKGGPAVEGFYAVTGLEIMYEDQAEGRAKAFFENYKKRFGNVPAEVAQGAYISADITVLSVGESRQKSDCRHLSRSS